MPGYRRKAAHGRDLGAAWQPTPGYRRKAARDRGLAVRLASPVGLAAAALAAPLVLWYVLRSRRPPLTVASTFLWRRTDRSVAAAIPWQRFHPDVTFVLVLAALLAGALALARPYLPVPAELGDHTVVIIDTSASMLADEDGPTRLELARRQVRGLVDRIAPGQQVSLVEAGSRARVLVSASSDAGSLRSALDRLRPSHGEGDLADALTLAAALERPGQATVVHLLTDGALPDAARAVTPPGTRVTAVGRARPNLAVTRLEVTPVGAGSSQAHVQVRNFGTVAAAATLTLTVEPIPRPGGTPPPGDPVVVETLDLAPRGTADRVLTVQGGDGAVLRARVEPAGTDATGAPQRDALGVDDQAFAILAARRELSVLVAGPGNAFLEAALGAVPGVTVATAPAVPAELTGTDVLVIDRVDAPAAATVPTLYVAPSRPPAGVEVAGEIERPALTFQATGHELLADVDLSSVGMADALRVRAPALERVAGGPDGPLLLAGRLDGSPAVLIAFDLLHSNLPLQAAWPVLVANTLSWLAGPPDAPAAVAGGTVILPAPPGASAILAVPPAGETVRLDPASPRLRTDQAGVWTLEYQGEVPAGAAVPAALAVNPPPQEGDLSRPRPDPPPDDGEVVAAGQATGRRPLTTAVVAAVLGLVLGEWAWSHGLRPRRLRLPPWRRGAGSGRAAGPGPSRWWRRGAARGGAAERGGRSPGDAGSRSGPVR